MDICVPGDSGGDDAERYGCGTSNETDFFGAGSWGVSAGLSVVVVAEALAPPLPSAGPAGLPAAAGVASTGVVVAASSPAAPAAPAARSAPPLGVVVGDVVDDDIIVAFV